MRRASEDCGGGEAGDEITGLSLDIEVDEERLSYPRLMDPGAVEELIAKGFEIYPAFRLRDRLKIDFDITLLTREAFAFSGDFVAHTWFLAAPPKLPTLAFRRLPEGPHRCLVSWAEEPATEGAAESRHNRYLELRHRGKGPQIPLAVIHKPVPAPLGEEEVLTPLSGCRDEASSDGGAEDSGAAVFSVSFRRIGEEVRPWFDLFNQELFPPKVEPELVLEARTRGFALEVHLAQGEFVAGQAGAPQVRFFDAFGTKIGQPGHIREVFLRKENKLRLTWLNPPEETVTSFEVLCRHRGEAIWLDPTIYTKGIGP